MNDAIAPHGGRLVNAISSIDGTPAGARYIEALPRVTLDERAHSDLELIACGVLSPLDGFMTEADHKSVVNDMRLSNGLVWSLPINVATDADTASKIPKNGDVVLADAAGKTVGVMRVTDKFSYDWKEEAQKVYLTTEDKHPGVAYTMQRKPILLGGPVQLLHARAPEFPAHARTPEQTRTYFREKGWKKIVAFQTRNPIHRAHEYLTKCALEVCDGLLVHPLVGETKSDDIPAPVRMKCYEALLAKYYPADRVLLSTLPAAMRYAGPREAIHHALMRKNYGVTHFIVGRDHAGVGNYYGTYDAQKMFDRFKPEELGIQPLMFEHTFWHTTLKEMVSNKTSPGPKEAHLALSGTKVREMLGKGEILPEEFTRPEVSKILIEHYRGK
ncbi:MAG: sulfate adenylyltransferase [Planctomycetes bacterium]|nr:sulfate adenylyltransferase [Planctomycetota bacterium]